jgi:hypothetical protein
VFYTFFRAQFKQRPVRAVLKHEVEALIVLFAKRVDVSERINAYDHGGKKPDYKGMRHVLQQGFLPINMPLFI